MDAKEALKYKPKDIVKIYNQKKSCFAFTYSSMISPDRIDFSFEFTGIPMKKGNVLLIASDRRMSVFTKSQHVEECKKFVDYFSNKDVQKKTLETFGKLPAYNNINVTLDKEMSDLQDVISKGNTMLLQDYNLKFEQWANLDDLCDGLLAGKTVQQQLDAFDAIQAEAIK